jgi:hypothetical protein
MHSCVLRCRMRCLHLSSNMKYSQRGVPRTPLCTLLQNEMSSSVEMPLIYMFTMIGACLFGPLIPVHHRHAPNCQMVQSGPVPSAIITVPSSESTWQKTFRLPVQMRGRTSAQKKKFTCTFIYLFLNKQNALIPAVLHYYICSQSFLKWIKMVFVY